MARLVRCGLIQARCEWSPEKYTIQDIRKMSKRPRSLWRRPRKKSRRFCVSRSCSTAHIFARNSRSAGMSWPSRCLMGRGRRMQELAKKYQMVIVVAGVRGEMPGFYLQHRGSDRCRRAVPRQVSQAPHPALPSRILGEVLFHPGQSRLPGFRNQVRQGRRIHLLRPPFPEGARILGLNGAEIVFNPSATVAGL